MNPDAPKPPSSAPPTDAQLVEAVRAGQTQALQAIYERYAATIYGIALQILQDPQEAQDVSQDVFTTLWRTDAYNPERGALASYLAISARSRAVDRLRAKSRKLRLAERWGRIQVINSPPSTLEQVSLGERAERVRAALALLPETQRRILELVYFTGCTQAEIARQLALPLGTIKSSLRLGLVKLRRSLQDLLT
jgi:RNA polymerase sigma-70 factor, ECF subfamily